MVFSTLHSFKQESTLHINIIGDVNSLEFPTGRISSSRENIWQDWHYTSGGAQLTGAVMFSTGYGDKKLIRVRGSDGVATDWVAVHDFKLLMRACQNGLSTLVDLID